MRTRNIDVSDAYSPTINLGRQGENAVSQVIFDVSGLITDYGSGTGVVVVRRPTEITTYQHDDTVQSGDTVTWTVSNADTEIAGTGNVQLFWMVNDAVAKTITYQTYVESALMNPTDAPVSDGGWISEEIGNLDDLNTTDKSNLVNAINEIAGGSVSGVTDELRQALLQIASKVAYIDEHGQDYYDDLYDALYAVTAIRINARSISLTTIGGTSQLTATTVPEGANVTWASSDESVATVDGTGLVTSTGYGSATITATAGSKSATCSVLVAQVVLISISATYTPSGTVYDSDTLDSLKSNLVVTALWDNGTSSEVPSSDYTLSGTLETGTSIITVSYGGKETTFAVTVVGLVSISAVYTQSGTVYDTATLDSLKSELVVTALYDDQTTETVTTYTLSGTLTEGTSTITVTYGGKTTTFDVAVTHQELPDGYTKYDYITHNVSFGTQVKAYGIWTEAQLSTDYTIEIKLKFPSNLGSNLQAYPLMGTRYGASGTKEIGLFFKYNQGTLGYWYNSTDSTTSITLTKGSVHTVKIQPVGISQTYSGYATIDIDGTEYSTGSQSTGVTFSSWFGIFTYATSANMGITTNDVIYIGQQIGEIKVTDSNDDIVYDFIPCKDSDDKYGFYEKVNGVFYYNSTYASTGFIGGSWE